MGCEDTYIIDKKGNKKNNQDYAATLTGGSHIGGNHSDMDLIKVPEATKKGYAEAEEGDSINLSVPNSKTRRGRVGKGEAQTLDTGMQQYTIQAKSVAHRTRTYAGQPAKIEERDDNVSNALNSAMKDSMVKIDTNIRRLTPVECNRLQGFSDDHNKYGVMDGKVVEMSDTQRYKQAGNAVTVDVVQAVATIIKEKELV
jgi:DNA (cytosine-5)-methyltransferase 1